ncbi:hypothetical protein [Flavobacterium sp.]|jgi:hypothetical protein|uniref:hypothetical protein n=1 Tax=Flavobacterium sp. TaxID=239 RepID=UPI002A83F104|nr:hypothetical protein [Flavobacterium sp.]
MKKLILLLLTLFGLTSFAPLETKNDLIGEWIGNDKGEIGKLVFQKNGYAYFVMGNQKFGGESFVMEGKKGSMKYTVDDKTNPFKIDLIISIEGTKIVKKQKCIAKFISKNKLNFAIGFEDERPTNFDGENSLIFNKHN